MKVILLEDVKSLGKKDCKCQRRICKKYDSAQEIRGGSQQEEPE